MEAHDEITEADVVPESQTTDEMLHQILAQQQEHRAEVAQLRQELAEAKSRTATPTLTTSTARSPEELQAERMEQVSSHSHYCPGCGWLFNYLRECVGRPEAPHPPIEAVPTDELHPDADPTKHTAAPNTDVLAPV